MSRLQWLHETHLAGREICAIFLTLLILLLTLCILKNFERNRYLARGFPGLKIKWYHFPGHLLYLPRGPAYSLLCPRNTYVMQVIDGLRTLYQKESAFGFWMFYNLSVIVHKADAVEKILSSTTILEKGWSYLLLHPWLGTGLLTSKGAKWKSRRKLLTPSFHFDILKEFLVVINEQSQILLDILKEGSEKDWIDITKPLTLCSLDIICETTLGVNINAQKDQDSEYVKAVFRTASAIMERMTSPAMSSDLLYYLSESGRQSKKDLQILHTFTRNVIHKKKEQLKENADAEQSMYRRKRKALMDLLLDHHMNHQDLTEEDIREEVDTFTFEGHDTTSMGLSWSLYLIGLNNKVQNKIHEELDTIFGDDDRHVLTEDLKDMAYLECVIKEVLRLYPSVPLISRQTTEDITLCGRMVPKGSECMVFTYGLHRNPDVFPNPEVFDPDRFLPENSVGRHPYAYVPFSAGPRNCIGQRFAMMELKVVLANVLRNFEVRSLMQRDELPATADLILRPTKEMKMKVIPRKKTEP